MCNEDGHARSHLRKAGLICRGEMRRKVLKIQTTLRREDGGFVQPTTMKTCLSAWPPACERTHGARVREARASQDARAAS